MQDKVSPTHHEIAVLLADNIIGEMTRYLMEDYGFELEKALSMVYSSHVVELLQIEEGELYVQAPAYVYEMLLKELRLYPLCDDSPTTQVAEK